MKHILTFLAVGFLSVGTLAAQSWNQNRPLAGVLSLKASAGVNVYLRQGNEETLRLDVKGFDEDEVVAEVRNGQLVIGRQKQGLDLSFGRNRYINAYVTVKQLSGIEVSSGADLIGETELRADNLSLAISSGADAKLTINARMLSVQVSSGADADLAGRAEKLTAQVSGGADLNARQLIAEVCYAQASGGADAHVHGTKELYLQASGGADVSYRGAGRLMSKKESGGGDVNQDK
jgi:hypothetical protein